MKRSIGPTVVLGIALWATTAAASGLEFGTAHLDLPQGPGPFPAVVLLTGCDASADVVQEWRRTLGRRGYALLTPGRETPGGGSICDASGSGSASRPALWSQRARNARIWLGGQASVDRSRIAVVGMADAGAGALLASRGRGFEAAVALHPWMRGTQIRSHAPVLVVARSDGAAAPSHDSREVRATATEEGRPIETRFYGRASHSFDDGHFLPTSLLLGRRGSFEAGAASRAHRDVIRFLAEHLGETVSTRVAMERP